MHQGILLTGIICILKYGESIFNTVVMVNGFKIYLFPNTLVIPKYMFGLVFRFVFIGLLIIVFSVDHLTAQVRAREQTLVALPIVFFTPETNWAFGAGASYTFHLDSLRQRPSTLQLGGVYTLRNQLLSYFSYNLFHPQQRWELSGELGYYNYTYKYWGIGNRLPAGQEESYEVLYPRLRIAPKYMLTKYWRIGISADINKYSSLDIEPGGILDRSQATGVKGGFVNGVGLQLQYDSREHTLFPIRGLYASSKILFYEPAWGSDYSFYATDIDVRSYRRIAGGVIWANQLMASLRDGGDVPFYHLSLLGGPKMMRGYFEGRYRDQNSWAMQTELRIPVWIRFFVVPFLSVGDVFNFERYQRDVKFAGGLGLRYIVDHGNRVNIRCDVAYGQNFQFYLSVLEAF